MEFLTFRIKLCIDPEHFLDDKRAPICKEKFELYIMPRNGLVIWPKSGRASMMELKPRAIADAEIYVIEVGFGYGDKVNGKLPGEVCTKFMSNSFLKYPGLSVESALSEMSNRNFWPKFSESKTFFLSLKKKQISLNTAFLCDSRKSNLSNLNIFFQFYVANMFREVVVSDSEWWDATAASKVAFFFEKSDDLKENKGIISQVCISEKKKPL